MKIAFDNQIFFQQKYGGISRYFKILNEELSILNHNSKIFAGFHCNSYLRDIDKELVNGVFLERYPWRTERLLSYLSRWSLNRNLRKWNPDIVHETYYSARETTSLKCARVTTAYDMIHELFSNEFSSEDKTSIAKKATFQRADHIISISHSTKNDLIRLFDIDENKITVVHLGVDENFASQRFNEKIVKTRPYLLYVGARQGYKNFKGLLKAVADNSRLRADLDIVAFGGGPFSEFEKQLITELNLGNNQVVQVSGDDKVLVSLYKNAEAFVYPSIYEGFGLPPLESMMCECPVVSSNTSSMPEVIGNAGEYFSPTDTRSIAHAISNVVYSSFKKEELIVAGRERVKLFTWRKCAEQTSDVYKKLIG